MKILLVQPHYKEIYGKFKSVAIVYYSLGLAYIAAVLEKNGHNVKIVDMPVENITEEKYIKILEEFQPSVVGISVLSSIAKYSYKLASITRKTLKNVCIVFGGVHPTIMPDEALMNGADVVVRGEGENTMLNLVNSIEKKSRLENILGISYWLSGRIRHNPDAPLIKDLDELPYPARHLYSGNYYFIDAKRNPIDIMMTARGCPFRCNFCIRVWGKACRWRQPTKVVDEMEYLINERGTREIHVLDDIFNLDLKRAKMICDEIIKRKLDLTWALPSGIRLNANLIDEELAEKLHASGCWLVAMGIESGDQSILDITKKDLKLEEIKRAVKILKNAGIEELWGYFIIGLWGDNETTIQKTIDFACELDIDVAKFSTLTPYPGSEVYDILEKNGILLTKDWSRYGIHLEPVYKLPTVSSKRLYELHKEAYKKFYIRRKIVIKMAKRIFTEPRRGWESLKTGYLILKSSLL
jgi:radical SAM superfamily enzyme YgiQ (UPF0313 family)